MKKWLSISTLFLLLAGTSLARVELKDKGKFIMIEDTTTGIQNVTFLRKNAVVSIQYYRNEKNVTLAIVTTERIATDTASKNKTYSYQINGWSEAERVSQSFLSMLNQTVFE